ncbi:hypothetical protein J2S74_001878 [Evansella vedderi]|uniref:Uncharacterized protein n=1 Tax=Evansella vedderi TaxID=38282 RepID=A0ABT9ZUE4_9BACI|nr:hypothetical protein [Evansella vedderi]MDQ0254499.1 hypothetical protein [Evansella vedderi]
MISRLEQEEYWTELFRKAHRADQESIDYIVSQIPREIDMMVGEMVYDRWDCVGRA